MPRLSSTRGSIEVTPVAAALGAEISGVDLAATLSDDVVTDIRRAWLEHAVVFFRDQPLGSDDFLALARRLGESVEYPFVKGVEGTRRSSRSRSSRTRR